MPNDKNTCHQVLFYLEPVQSKIQANLSALVNFRSIQPTSVASADKESQLIVSGIGQLTLIVDKQVYHVNCYSSIIGLKEGQGDH